MLISAASPDKRSFARVRPRGLVSLAMYQGERIPPAFGIVSDISETGACIHSDRVHFRGQKLQLRIQFASEPELFEIQARVRWIKPALGGENGLRGGALAGIEFYLPSSTSMSRLRRLLVSPDFEYPQPGSRDFEEFLKAMRPFLVRLGALLDEMSKAHQH
ncbi:MAG TPA: PilZ domain-containing protein [Vicinamibacteria bacterium]|nr:PilZ domain-containing protein [Vicinamibacteria bacterium]